MENQEEFDRWLSDFRPDKGTRYGSRVPVLDGGVGYGFEVIPPASYPAIVIYTRIRRIGLTECEFYWDYVYPGDFPSEVAE